MESSGASNRRQALLTAQTFLPDLKSVTFWVTNVHQIYALAKAKKKKDALMKIQNEIGDPNDEVELWKQSPDALAFLKKLGQVN